MINLVLLLVVVILVVLFEVLGHLEVGCRVGRPELLIDKESVALLLHLVVDARDRLLKQVDRVFELLIGHEN